MDRSRLTSRDLTSSLSLQRRRVEETRPRPITKPEQRVEVPDLSDFMGDVFFGTTNKKAYNSMGGGGDGGIAAAKDHDYIRHRFCRSQFEDEEDDFDSSTRSNSSRLTQEWLEEARRMMAASPGLCDSPARLVGSPRFAAANATGRHSLSSIDRRDPLSRSARRYRALDSFSGEILSKSAKHSRNQSDTLIPAPTADSSTAADHSPASNVHQWLSTLLKPANHNPTPTSESEPHPPPSSASADQPPLLLLRPRQFPHRRSRFQSGPSVTAAPPQPVPPPHPHRRFKTLAPSPQDAELLSPPKNLVESAHRRSISSSTCSLPDDGMPRSPPRCFVESAHRRSISSSTSSLDKILPRAVSDSVNGRSKEDGDASREVGVNAFLKEQRVKIDKILSGEVNARARIVLSGPSNSTSSMIAAICYAWLLEKRLNKGKGGDMREGSMVVPVMNVRRGTMWKLRQAAWLFHHAGLDATSLLFADEVDLESLMMAGKLSMLVVGQDILKTNGEVGSQCTILTDNYCEEAYDLLQTVVLKKLLLAGTLLDTRNLNASCKLSTSRDAEAVQLLLVGSAPNYRNALFDQLMQDSQNNSFIEALHNNYGKPPNESGSTAGFKMEQKVSEIKSTSVSCQEGIKKGVEKNSHEVKNVKTDKISPKSDKQSATPAQPQNKAPDAGRGKNKFFLARWFGFGSK